MGTSRIEQIIEDIYDFVESCKPQAFSSSKVVVPKDELYDLLDELKLRTPDEIKRYQKIIANRDSILADAEKKAEAMIAEARAQVEVMINESDVMQMAYERARQVMQQAEMEAGEMLQEANEDAGQIRTGALAYSEEVLGEVEKVLAHAFESARSRCEGLIETLHGSLEVVSANRNELAAELYGRPEEMPQEYEAQSGEQESDYDFQPDTFLEDIE